MRRQLHAVLALWTAFTLIMTGCAPTQPFYMFEDGDMSHYVGMATKLEHPDVETCSLDEVQNIEQPFTVSKHEYSEIWELELQDAVRYALENSKVMRTLGGRQASFGGSRPQTDEAPELLLRTPGQINTVYDPAIQETDPNFGIAGALSHYDAVFSGGLFYEKNDRPQNVDLNPALIPFGLNRVRQQDLGTWNNTLSKRTATGGLVSLGSNTIYENSNNTSRETPSDWNQNFEATVRQPLLQGAGVMFNQIAAPFDPFIGTGTLAFDGVLLARIRTDISLADFEAGVRDLVNEVETTYWNLYFGYRNLEARKVGRDSALQSWRKVHALYMSGTTGGDLAQESQAKEQFFFFKGEVETALSDLFRAENRLRYLMGLSASDGRLIAPVTEPTIAQVTFDVREIYSEALTRSVELRQQKWRIKQRELELMASKNLLLPRLDAVARYRWLGLGENWIDKDGSAYTGGLDSIIGTDAMSGVASGDFQETQIGVQYSMSIGFRQAMAGVRQQQLLLARDRSILQDMELELQHQLVETVQLLDVTYGLMGTNFNRVQAARSQVEAVMEQYNAGTITLDLVLDAQRREADALSTYARALTDYNRNIAQMHYRKGTLLEYNDVYLAEGPWPGKAYFDAHRRARARDAAYFLDYGFKRPDVISQGEISQQSDGMNGGEMWEGPIQGIPVEARPLNGPPEELPIPADAAKLNRATRGKVGAMQPNRKFAAEANDLIAASSKPGAMRTAAVDASPVTFSAEQASVGQVASTREKFDWSSTAFGGESEGLVPVRKAAAKPAMIASAPRASAAASSLKVAANAQQPRSEQTRPSAKNYSEFRPADSKVQVVTFNDLAVDQPQKVSTAGGWKPAAN
ncbi:MAG: TolC family protein [Planctomycetota bacterium]|nr:TolC family protein [Planctomycetota bacterium]